VLTWYVVTRSLHLLLAKRDPGGDAANGLVIFAESLRWLNVRWGMGTCAAGLRRAGFRGEFLYWRWHATWRALLVLPVIAAPRMLEREARRLAEFIVARRRAHPDRPIWLIGYSCGGYLVPRALELLPEDVNVESAALLAAAQSPWRDLNPPSERIKGRLIVASSPLDAVVVGLGTLIAGTGDRVHTPSLGMLGYRGPTCDKILQVRWRPGMILDGQFGGHFSAAAERFVARHIAPRIGIDPAGSVSA
jgi:pimeloyl-ACP methyl ester carboxylesterase